MADELDERVLDHLAPLRIGGDHVGDAIEGVHETQAENGEGLEEDIFPTEAWHALVPDAGQQLLHVRVRYERFLFALYRQLQSLQRLS